MKREKATILATNDDGIHSPGLWHMVEELKQWATVYVVAPQEEQSGTSLSISVRKDLTIQRCTEFSHERAWSVSGTPADCVKTALSVLNIQPDIIVSGINKGSNAGKNLLYSGTVGGAVEGALRGFQAIAFSSYNAHEPAFEQYASYTSPVVQHMLRNPPHQGIVLNVNFPCPQIVRALPSGRPIRGFKLARQGKEYLIEKPNLIEAPNAERDHHQTIFRMGIQLAGDNLNDSSTDVHWLKQGYATCVPVYVEDLTHLEFLAKEQSFFETLLS